MAITDIGIGSVAPVYVIEQLIGPAGGTIAAGNAIYRDATSGQVYATGNGTANTLPQGIALNAAVPGGGVTGVRKGLVDLGGTVLTGLPVGSTIYAVNTGGTAGPNLGTTGAAYAVLGTVDAAFGSRPAANGALNGDRVLRVNL